MANETTTAQQLLADANGGIVGISEASEVFGGYDNTYPEAHAANINHPPTDWESRKLMARAEAIALADIMIARWKKYRDEALCAPPSPPDV